MHRDSYVWNGWGFETYWTQPVPAKRFFGMMNFALGVRPPAAGEDAGDDDILDINDQEVDANGEPIIKSHFMFISCINNM